MTRFRKAAWSFDVIPQSDRISKWCAGLAAAFLTGAVVLIMVSLLVILQGQGLLHLWPKTVRFVNFVLFGPVHLLIGAFGMVGLLLSIATKEPGRKVMLTLAVFDLLAFVVFVFIFPFGA